MRYFIVAGEPSGDLHGANLAKAIRSYDPDAALTGTGGDLMAGQSVDLVLHYQQMAFMGFAEVLLNIRTILRNLKTVKVAIHNANPDLLILIDYPGFNMRLASWAKKKGIRVAYYISPQVWAWKQNRVFTLKKVTDRILTILPFEKEFFARFGLEVDYVGHPLVDVIDQIQFSDKTSVSPSLETDERPLIALLPGSRKQEISRMLPIMVRVAKSFPDHQFLIAGAPGQTESYYHSIIPESMNIVFGKTYDLLHHSKAALVTSGTATLETALIGTPQVVCYKAGFISYQIARRLVKVQWISLVNLIMGREIVTELIQEELNENRLRNELHKLLKDQKNIDQLKSDYLELKEKLGGGGASLRAAKLIVTTANKL